MVLDSDRPTHVRRFSFFSEGFAKNAWNKIKKQLSEFISPTISVCVATIKIQ